jgi:4-amino-4-deoxy-L-arabinose transferase-like glycosyltransferase
MVLAAGGDADEARLALVGRVFSALFDTATILLTFAMGRLLYDSKVGVLAAALVALTVMHIQLAHFATFDTSLTCFAVATLLFAVRLTRDGGRRETIAAGLCLGLAVGAKFSGVLLLLPLGMAHWLHWDRAVGGTGRSLRGPAGLMMLSLLVAFLVFALTNPFALLQPDAFLSNLQDQGGMLRGDDRFPFTRQYHGTRPYLYSVEQQLRWGMGLPLGLVAFGGVAFALYRAWRGPVRAEIWVLLSWVAVYFGLVGSLYVKFMRYMLPVSPAFAIMGAGLVCACARQLDTWRQRMPVAPGWAKGLGIGLGGVVILPTLFYALAFLNVYRGDHPWLNLSNWIY